MIVTKNLTRTYQSYTKAEGLSASIKGLWKRNTIEKSALLPTNLVINQGESIGLVGANGAGKTTLIKILSGLIYPTQGEVTVLGFTPHQRNPEFLRQIGVILGQKNQLWWDLSPNDSFALLEKIYNIPTVTRKARVDELAHWLNCEKLLTTQIRRLSLGERMKMEIIGALIHRPKILFLDEPTIGLDVLAQNKIRSFLELYIKNENPTLILTSHYMADISHLSKRLLLMSQGQIKYDGPIDKFIQSFDEKKHFYASFTEPVKYEIDLGFIKIPYEAVEISAEINAHQVTQAISTLLAHTQIKEIKIEERNFEDVMRQFFESQI